MLLQFVRYSNLLLWKLKLNKFFPFQETLTDIEKYFEWRKKDFEKDYPLITKCGIDLKDLEILDFGCGLGTKLEVLENFSPKRIVGCDINKVDLDYAKRRIDGKFLNIELKLNTETKLPFDDESFDLILSFDVFEHISDIESMFKELFRVLKPRGRIFFKFQPYEAAYAHHAMRILLIPWVHLFFSFQKLKELTNFVNLDILNITGENRYPAQPYINYKRVPLILKQLKSAGFNISTFEIVPLQGNTIPFAKQIAKIFNLPFFNLYLSSIVYGQGIKRQ